ncbi:MAG: sigma-70 family RNA polymerase sigma factor [Candidatus Omnitrophica bacterium]|nr:sigma-70 family RNA polymerase sigma factor [Candidatus Omnitrophota bacterium]
MYFEELAGRISPKLRAIAKKLERREAFFDADDLYQESLILLWEKSRKGELDDKTDSYILQGCFYFLKNYIRVTYKTLDRNSKSIDELSKNNENGKTGLTIKDPENRFAFMVVDILVEDILPSLTGREKEVFLLSIDEMTSREIGKILGISHVMVVKIGKKIREKCASLREEIINNKLPG